MPVIPVNCPCCGPQCPCSCDLSITFYNAYTFVASGFTGSFAYLNGTWTVSYQGGNSCTWATAETGPGGRPVWSLQFINRPGILFSPFWALVAHPPGIPDPGLTRLLRGTPFSGAGPWPFGGFSVFPVGPPCPCVACCPGLPDTLHGQMHLLCQYSGGGLTQVCISPCTGGAPSGCPIFATVPFILTRAGPADASVWSGSFPLVGPCGGVTVTLEFYCLTANSYYLATSYSNTPSGNFAGGVVMSSQCSPPFFSGYDPTGSNCCLLTASGCVCAGFILPGAGAYYTLTA